LQTNFLSNLITNVLTKFNALTALSAICVQLGARAGEPTGALCMLSIHPAAMNTACLLSIHSPDDVSCPGKYIHA